jgi:hypothetical protein
MKKSLVIYIFVLFNISCIDADLEDLSKHNSEPTKPVVNLQPNRRTFDMDDPTKDLEIALANIFGKTPKNNKLPAIPPKFKERCTSAFLNIDLLRPCKDEEKYMIQSISKIIWQIKNFDPKSLKTDFYQTSEGSNPKVMIFGENHLATMGQIQTLGAINSLAKKGDILLLEGGDKKSSKIKHCAAVIIYGIYTLSEYRNTLVSSSEYSPESVSIFTNLMRFIDFFKSTIHSYDFSGLKLNNLQCYFWDLGDDLVQPGKNRKVIKDRNLSMVNSIKDWTAKGHRVFIITGYGHMPLGELLREFSESRNFHSPENFYSAVKAEKKKLKELKINYSNLAKGTSKVLWRYLQTIAHSQLIHERMFIDPYRDF